MSIVIAIAGLAFLVLIHELGHFVAARAVSMRPRQFYVFFPPPLVKTVRGGTEYGIGTIPLGGYVKIPGMHRPASGDVDAHFGRALDESPWLARHAADVKEGLDREDHAAVREALPLLAEALERADLSEAARRSAEKGLAELDDALSPDAYWRAPAWKRITVIGIDEASRSSGIKGEKASSDTSSGDAASRYSTEPMGYSPVNAMSFQPDRFRGRVCSLPRERTLRAKP